MSFAGHMLVELIALKDDRPSVWREGVERLGHGFHHFGVGTADYDGEIARHAEQGHALAFECAVPTGGRVGCQSMPNVGSVQRSCPMRSATGMVGQTPRPLS